jgi:hypothetical protein
MLTQRKLLQRAVKVLQLMISNLALEELGLISLISYSQELLKQSKEFSCKLVPHSLKKLTRMELKKKLKRLNSRRFSKKPNLTFI